MSKVLARIVIDPEEWNDLAVQYEEASVMQWKRVHTSHAVAFEPEEIDSNAGIFSHQYFF